MKNKKEGIALENRVAVYCRSATGNRDSVDSQERQARDYIAQYDKKEVVLVCRDIGQNGLELCRPGLNLLRYAAKQQMVSVIVVLDKGRLSRDEIIVRLLEQEMRNHHVAVVYVSEKVTPYQHQQLSR